MEQQQVTWVFFELNCSFATQIPVVELLCCALCLTKVV
jgi:hypothetical protein